MHTITKNNQTIPVTGIDVETAVGERLFNKWLDSCDPTWKIEAIEVQSIDRDSKGRAFYIKVKVDIEHKLGKLPGMVILIRDYAVAVLVVLTCNNTKYAMLVDQPRVAAGNSIYETIAGMIDDGKDPKSVVYRELEEEAQAITKLGIAEGDIVSLLDQPFYMSPGCINEAIYPFLVEKEITQEALDSYQGFELGLEEEFEHTTVRIVPLEKILDYCFDSKTIAMLHLYDRYLLTKKSN